MRDTEKNNFPLSALSTLGTGGTAEFFAQPSSIPELQEILKAAKNLPVYVIGGGSNILIPDGEIEGLTVSTRNLNSIEWQSNFTAEIGAGFPLSKLIRILTEKNLGGLGIAEWTKPAGGYFISFDGLEGTAKKIVEKARKAGVILTGAGATWPYGKDPKDSNIRIAPSYPPIEDLKIAAELFTVCVRYVSLKQLIEKAEA